MRLPVVIPVVAVALVRGDGQVLLQRRAISGRHPGLWEFPGGKVEPGETLETAAIREIAEELGIEVAAAALRPLAFASDPTLPPAARDPHVILLYAAHRWSGEPRCLVGEAIGWFAPSALSALAMPPLDLPLSAALVAYLVADSATS